MIARCNWRYTQDTEMSYLA